MPFSSTTIHCASARPRGQHIGLGDLFSSLLRVDSVNVTLQGPPPAKAGLPTFHDLASAQTRSMEEYLLQLPMSQLVRNAALSVGSFLRLPSSTLAGLRTVSCRPDIQDVLDLARSTEDDWVSFSCQVPTSAFCVPDAAVLGLADRRFEIVAVQQNESHTSLWAAVSLIVGFALLFLRPIYVEDRVLSHVSFTVFMCMWTVAAPSLLYAAAALGVSIVSHVVLPRLHRAQLQTFFQAASIILVSEASSFAYGSIFLLALYLFTWVVHTAINVGIADEREEAEALQEYMDQRSDHVKQEGLHDIVDAVLEDDSILKRLSDKALQQIARMAQARTESGPTARLDDLPEDERLLYGIYQEGRAAAERLRRARWLPLAVAVLAVGLLRLDFATSLLQMIHQ